jgi:hypothetical protein
MTDLAPDDPRHGTVNGYTNLRCHCQPCKDAFAGYVRKRRAERRAGEVPPTVQHGLPSTYSNWRCQCRPCLDAHAAEMRAYNHAQREVH